MTQNPHTPPKDQQEDTQLREHHARQVLETLLIAVQRDIDGVDGYIDIALEELFNPGLIAREPQPTPTNDSDEQLRKQLNHIWGKCNDRKPCAWYDVLKRTAELAREHDNHFLSTDYASLELTAALIAQARKGYEPQMKQKDSHSGVSQTRLAGHVSSDYNKNRRKILDVLEHVERGLDPEAALELIETIHQSELAAKVAEARLDEAERAFAATRPGEYGFDYLYARLEELKK